MSEIVSTLLLVAIVVSLGVVAFTFASGTLSSLTGGFTGLISGQENSDAEHLVVEQVTFTNLGGGSLPITLTGGAGTATPTSFQQEVTWDPATYSAYEASNLGNIRFCTTTSCTTELYSWLESCGTSTTPSYTSCTSGSAYAIAWVNLGSLTVPATPGTLTIYMVFYPTTTNFDDNYWGESPQLSSTYAQYDNGANVFASYFDGNTPTSDFTLTTGGTYAIAQSVGYVGPGGGTINAIEVTGYGGANPDPVFAFNKAMANAGLITEASFSNVNYPTGSGITGFVDSATAANVRNGIGVGDGAGSSYFAQDSDIAGAVTYGTNAAGAGTAAWLYASLTYTGPSSTSFYSQITPALYGTPGQTAGTGYSGTDTPATMPLATATNLYLGTFAASSGGYTLAMYYNFVRARLYPPSGDMPTVALGSVSSTTNAGANVYVRNVGSISSTLVSVYVSDQTTGTFVGQFPTSTVVNAGSYVDVPYTTVSFSWSHGQTYTFTVTSILGNSVNFNAEAT